MSNTDQAKEPDLQEMLKQARQEGWDAKQRSLMGNGSQLGCDFHSKDGKLLGRFNGYLPASTVDDRI